MRSLLVPVAVALALTPTHGRAQPGGRAWVPGESGFVVATDLGAGTAFGTGSRYTKNARFELELSAGYEFPLGIRPELAFVAGAAPSGHVGLRPGVHVALPESPLYLRGAMDWSSLGGPLRFRWLLAGGGGELRLTGLLAGFAEADVGIPVRSDAGVELLFRAGITLRL